jgi:hypothetical protein
MTLADLTPSISTTEEQDLFDVLYHMHTANSRTNWEAFCAEWNGIASQHKRMGSVSIKHKTITKLKRYHDKVAKEARAQTSVAIGLPLQAGQPQQQPQQQQQQAFPLQQQYQYRYDSTAAAAAAVGAATAAAAGSGLFGGGLDPSMLFMPQQPFTGMLGMPYMPAPGQYDMPMPSMAAAAAAGGGGGFGVGLGTQGQPFGAFDPAAAMYNAAGAAAKRAAWVASRPQRQQPPKSTRKHKKHRCNNCWRELAGQSREHKNGKDDWDKGLRCPGDCANCGSAMSEHM